MLIPRFSRDEVPIHLAVNTSNITEWAEENDASAEEAAERYVEKVDGLFGFQLDRRIPILSVKLLHTAEGLQEELTEYFKDLAEDDRIHDNKVRVFIIGQWYDLDSELVQAMKKLMEQTKDYDENFLNFCIAYDGQEEIVSAVRVIARQVKLGKIDLEDIDEDIIKQNLFSSYFPPPDLIVENSRVYSGMLLWDAKKALIYFTDKIWMDTEEEDYEEALKFYAENNE